MQKLQASNIQAPEKFQAPSTNYRRALFRRFPALSGGFRWFPVVSGTFEKKIYEARYWCTAMATESGGVRCPVGEAVPRARPRSVRRDWLHWILPISTGLHRFTPSFFKKIVLTTDGHRTTQMGNDSRKGRNGRKGVPRCGQPTGRVGDRRSTNHSRASRTGHHDPYIEHKTGIRGRV